MPMIRGEVLKLRERRTTLSGRPRDGVNNITTGRTRAELCSLISSISLNIGNNVQVTWGLAFPGLGMTGKPSWGRMT